MAMIDTGMVKAECTSEGSRRAEQMRRVVDLGRRLSAILDPHSLLETTVVEVQAALRCPLVALATVEDGKLRLAALAGEDGLAQLPADATTSTGLGLCACTAQSDGPVYAPDVTRDARYVRPPGLSGTMRSAAAVPIRLGEELLGVLDAESDRLAAFDAADLAFLEAIANQVAVAIGNARTHAQAARRARMLQALLHTTQELSSTLDLRRLLEVIAYQVQSLLQVDGSVIFLVHPDTGILTPVIALHEHGDQVLSLALRPGQGISGHVAVSGVAEIVNNAEGDPRFVRAPGQLPRPQSLLSAPLKGKERVIGVMTLNRFGERPFEPEDLEILETFAGHAAMAIENARLYAESRLQARELQQAHARLEQAHNQLVQAEKLSAIGKLAAGIAHELNNPLTAILGYAQFLQAEPLSASARMDLQRIMAAAERTKTIVANLLAFARQERLALQSVDLAALLECTLQSPDMKATTGGVNIRRELEPGLPQMQLDPLQIQHLIVHLLRNACRATQQAGGRRVLVRLYRPRPGMVRLEVADEGPGVPAEILPHIFDPFFVGSEVGAGHGLGLSACLGIVKAHGGHIWATAHPPGGSVFVAELPLEPGQDLDPQGVRGSCWVLIVTADPSMTESLRAIVEEMGHRPAHAESGEAALAGVVVRRYDLILCDVTLPGMGIERLYESVCANDPGLEGRFVAIGDPGATPAHLLHLDLPIDPLQVQEVVEGCLAGAPAGR
jgi:signal transduction histidine kinase